MFYLITTLYKYCIIFGFWYFVESTYKWLTLTMNKIIHFTLKKINIMFSLKGMKGVTRASFVLEIRLVKDLWQLSAAQSSLTPSLCSLWRCSTHNILPLVPEEDKGQSNMAPMMCKLLNLQACFSVR